MSGFEELIKHLAECEELVAIALGGSRSRNQFTEKSDFDIFCVVQSSCFSAFRTGFAKYIERCKPILFAAEMSYVEHWGYIYKSVDCYRVLYDISIIPLNRINEISVRSTNIVLKDTNDIYRKQINNANDILFQNDRLETERYIDYIKLFAFEYNRFLSSIRSNDYWYAVRCLERLKNYYIRCDRIQRSEFPISRSCPEKKYFEINQLIQNTYVIDGSIKTLYKTGKEIFSAFREMIEKKDVFDRCDILWQIEK